VAARKFTAEDLLSFRLPGDPQISPDGARIAYVETWTARESNEYKTRIMMVAPGGQPVQFTSGEKDSNPRWSPDGRYLSFSRSGQIWLLPLAGGEARQLTKHKGCGGPAVWSPDGTRIALTVQLGPEGLEPEKADEEKDCFKKFTAGVRVVTDLHYKADGQGLLGDKRPQVVIVDVESCETRQLTAGNFGHTAPAWSPDGSLLAVASKREEDADDKRIGYLWSVPAQPEAWPAPADAFRRVTPDGVIAYAPAWSPDGSRIAFTGMPAGVYGSPDAHLYVVPAEGGGARDLTEGHDRHFGNAAAVDLGAAGAFALTWSADSSALFAPVSDGGSVCVAQVEAATGTVRYLTPPEQVVFAGSITADGGKLAAAVGDLANPADIYLVEDGEQKRLTAVNAELLAEVQVAPVTRFRFRAAAPGSPEVDGWVVAPPDREPGRKCPAILEIHGGPAGMYASAFHMEFQYLAALGYAVIYTNPRGGLGYGRTFSGALSGGKWGTVDYADLMAGVDAALVKFDWIDKERLGVAGGSYGGYMTNWIVGHTDRFKAAVTMRSISNWMTMWATSDIAYSHMEEWTIPWEDDSPWVRQSPITFLKNIKTPLLIEHQEQDHRCPVEQAEQLYVALRKLRRPVKFVRYPGESHGMSRGGKPWHRVHRLLTIGAWFNEYLA
jgi:dipeptidyl aminopeptidase/acylaminoacyl peptidase